MLRRRVAIVWPGLLGTDGDQLTYLNAVNVLQKIRKTTHVLVIFGLGTAGDYLVKHNGHKFSTNDQDNDASHVHCAKEQAVKGAWWYYKCMDSNLNGVYPNGADRGTIMWRDIPHIERAEMKIRPVDF